MAEIQDIKSGYRQTSVGLIPKIWSVVSIGDVLKIGSGKDYKHLNYGDIPVYGTGGLMTYVDDFLFDGESVGIGRKGTIDKPVFLNGKFWTVDTLFYTHSFNGTIPKLVFYLFQNIDWYKYNEASGVPSLSKNTIEKIKIPLPPLPEQQKIAEILSTWDEAITLTKSTIEELKKRNKGLAQQLLTGKKRLKGFEGEWEEQHLEHYFKERKETNHQELPLLSLGEIGVYPQTDSNKKDTSNKDKSKYKRICPGDIGYNTMRMWQGRSALSSLEGIVSPAYTIVTPKKNADAQFFAYLFKLDEVIHKFFRKSQGLVSDTLNCKFKDFKIVKVLTPPSIEEQTAIVSVLENADKEIRLHQQQLNTLKEQKKGLMQKLLTGEIRVKTD